MLKDRKSAQHVINGKIREKGKTASNNWRSPHHLSGRGRGVAPPTGERTAWRVGCTGWAAEGASWPSGVQYNYPSICLTSLHLSSPVYLSIIDRSVITSQASWPGGPVPPILLFSIFSSVISGADSPVGWFKFDYFCAVYGKTSLFFFIICYLL